MHRYLVLPSRGPLLVSSDLHGNRGDFRRLREIFLSLRAEDEAAHWVMLGDLVHGPDAETRREGRLYDYPDESRLVVEEVAAARRDWPGHVHLLLGNHDHGHVGGRHTGRFHHDEVRHLEAALRPEERSTLRALFEEALLVALAPCGLLLCHGCPSDLLRDHRQVDGLSLRADQNDADGACLLATLLTAYGQRPEVTARMLRQVSASSGLELGLVVHGHDRDEAGWFSDGPHQLCPVIFGAPREAKRYLVVDLAARYPDVSAIRDGFELRRLYED